MRILITNDDGMHASQLPNLVRWARKLGDVTVVVPNVEHSGKAHGIEIHKPFKAYKVRIAEDIEGWAVESTPADCVRFAVLGQKMEFDLVISGVNRGLNIGTDTLYSGTVGAASEGVLLGFQALALSTTPANYDHATEELDRVWAFIQKHKLYELNDIYNVNIPAEAGPIRVTHQGGPYFSDEFPLVGQDLYQPTGICVWENRNDPTLDTDTALTGFISISPLTIDRTNWAVYDKIKDLRE